jgi:hypothetical protein
MPPLTNPFKPPVLAVPAPRLWGCRWRRPTWQVLLFLLGMGHQNFFFSHKIALSGSLPGFALVVGAANRCWACCSNHWQQDPLSRYADLSLNTTPRPSSTGWASGSLPMSMG